MAGRDGEAEEKVLRRLRAALAKRFRNASFKLEPFGSFVTQLGLRDSGETQGRSDLDVVMLFRDSAADTFTHSEVRERLVGPTINALGRWLPSLHGVVVKNVIRHARVPIVKFETKEVSVDISVQQPWGVLNSWHLRDLCNSGRPGRLRSLARMVKAWAKSKGISTAKDGSLSSYGYSMLAASFLQDRDGLPSILPRASRAGGSPYMDAEEALEHVLAASSSGRRWGRRPRLWSPPERFEPDDLSGMAVFLDWLGWMATTVLGFAGACSEAPGGAGAVPLEHRHIVSVRPGTQEELRADVASSPKVNEHWEPGRQEVFMLIEEPLNGENVARCVRAEGFWAIVAEVDRARRHLAGARGRQDGGLAAFQALLWMPPVSHVRRQLPKSVGLPSQRMGPTRGNAKRPRLESAGEAEAQTASPTLPSTRALHQDRGTKPDEAKEKEEEEEAEAEDEQLVSPEMVNGQWSGSAVREIGAPAAPVHAPPAVMPPPMVAFPTQHRMVAFQMVRLAWHPHLVRFCNHAPAHALVNIHPAEARVKPVFCAGPRAASQDVPLPGQVEQPAPQGGGRPMPQALQWSFSATTGRFCILWSVESRKLRDSDQQVESPSFDLTCGGRPVKFKMLLDAMQVTDQKGGGLFEKTNGSRKGSVSVKCEADLSAGMGSLTYRLFIGSGDTTISPRGILITQQPPRGPVTHDFSTSAFSSLPRESKEWDFSAATDEASQTFIVGLEVQQ